MRTNLNTTPTTTPANRTQHGVSPSTEEIAARAYELWKRRGSSEEGSAELDWYRAEEELRDHSSSEISIAA